MILNARSEGVGRKVKLYPSDRFAKIAGVWRPISEIASVRWDKDRYVVLCGKESIELVPDRAVKDATSSRVVKPRRFGDILSADAAPDIAEYHVTTTGRVAQEPMGWRFADVEGAQVGLFLHDWAARFGADKVLKSDGAASVDLRAAKTDGVERINLDPTLTPAGGAVQYQVGGEDWPSVRSSDNAASEGESIHPKSGNPLGVYFSNFRAAFAFDTSAAAASVASATLHVYREDNDDAAYFVRIPDSSFDHTDPYPPDASGLDVYEECLAAYGTPANQLGSVPIVGDNGWKSLDVTSQYAVESDWTVGVMTGHDAENVAPTEWAPIGPVFADPGEANEPYLLIDAGGGHYRRILGDGYW